MFALALGLSLAGAPAASAETCADPADPTTCSETPVVTQPPAPEPTAEPSASATPTPAPTTEPASQLPTQPDASAPRAAPQVAPASSTGTAATTDRAVPSSGVMSSTAAPAPVTIPAPQPTVDAVAAQPVAFGDFPVSASQAPLAAVAIVLTLSGVIALAVLLVMRALGYAHMPAGRHSSAR